MAESGGMKKNWSSPVHFSSNSLSCRLMQYYSRSIEIAADQEVVYRFHTDPANLIRITPPGTKVRILEHGAPGEGVEIILRIRPYPFISQKWHMRFEEFDPPRRLTDVMLSGPFRRWKQTREFVPLCNGHTLLNDSVEYELPFGTLGRLAHRLFLARHIEQLFTYRQQVTKKLLENHSA